MKRDIKEEKIEQERLTENKKEKKGGKLYEFK